MLRRIAGAGLTVVLLLMVVKALAADEAGVVSHDGVFDFAAWEDVPGKQEVRLSGRWGFSWEKQLSPKEWQAPEAPWFDMPGTWDIERVSDTVHSGRGFATFTAELINIPEGVDWALLIPEQSTAYRLFANDDIIAEGGIAGVSPASSRAYSGNRLFDLGKLPPVVKLTWHVSNFHHDSGGPWQSLVIAPRHVLQEGYSAAAFDQTLVLVLALIASIFLILQYTVDREDKASLALAVFALVIALRVGIMANQPLYDVLGTFPWQLHIRLLYLTMLIALPIVVYWQHCIFPEEMPYRIVKTITRIFAVPVVFLFLLPSHVFTSMLMAFQLLILATLPVFIYSVYKIIRNHRNGGYYLMAGILVLVITSVHDIALYSQWIADGRIWIPYGMLGFLLALAVNMLFVRAKQQQQVKFLSQQLMQANKQLEARVAQRTLELAEKADALEEANEKLQVLANIDGLTGVLNRRAFVEQLQMLSRTRPDVAIVMLDVDHFKQINDIHGHAVGDIVLQRLAQLLLDMKREADRVGRFGGEEFVIMLQGLSSRGLESYCRRLISEVSRMHVDEIDGSITVSVGATTGSLTAANVDRLLQEADEAMYQVKRTGRNNYRLAEPGQKACQS